MACGRRLGGPPAPAPRAPRDHTPKQPTDEVLQSKSALEAIGRALPLRRVGWDGLRTDVVDARARLACGEREAVARGRLLTRRLGAPRREPEVERVAAALGD